MNTSIHITISAFVICCIWFSAHSYGEETDLITAEQLSFIADKDGYMAGKDFANKELARVNLSNAFLKQSSFFGSDLQESLLTNVFAELGNFAKSNLTGANLQRSYLVGANFQKAKLFKSDFSWSNLRQADFRGARGMASSTFHGVIIDHTTKGWHSTERDNVLAPNTTEKNHFRYAQLYLANMSHAKFADHDFDHANLQSTLLHSVDFSESSMKQANLQNSYAHHANFRNSNLSGADLGGASLQNTDFRGANLKNSNFSGSNIKGADFTGALNFHTARFSFVSMDENTRLPK